MLNKVILVGRLTADPQMRQTPSGVSMCRFSVAVDRPFTSKETGQREADFINVVAWRSTAEFVSKYFHKGSSICVIGSIQTRKWQDQNGQNRYITEVIADEVNFVDSKSDSSSRQAAAPAYTPDSYGAPSYSSGSNTAPKFEEMSNEDDLPF